MKALLLAILVGVGGGLVLLLGGSVSCAAAEVADMVVVNAQVITVDEERPRAEAFAVKSGKIMAVGKNDKIKNMIGAQTKVIDAKGRTVLPGFYDCHLHAQELYDEMSPYGKIDCRPESTATIESVIARLKAKAKITPKGKWVRGSRYQDTKLGRHLNRYDLDKASTEHPVYVSHSSGHVAAVNSKALELAGVNAKSKDPAGGAFDRGSEGEPTGVLRESAMGYVRSRGPSTPKPSREKRIKAQLKCFEAFMEKGITSFGEAGISPKRLAFYREVHKARPTVRMYVMISSSYLDELKELIQAAGRGDEWIRIGAVKSFHGNSLSGQTCWLSAPYADRPDYFGIPPTRSQKRLNDKVWKIHEAGLQSCIHSNGDREIDMVLKAYELALQRLPRKDHRHRIEHCSVVNEELLRRIKDSGVALATHSYVYEHGDKMEVYGAERWDMMHPNRSCLEMGIPIGGNSDYSVSAAWPMLRIQSMVTRKTSEGKVYGARQRISVEDAIRTWTVGSAFLCFEEKSKGSITPGKLADFIVLSADPLKTDPDQLKDIDVEMTVIGGRTMYKR